MPFFRTLLVAVFMLMLTALAGASAASAAPIHDDFERTVLAKINGLRANEGLTPLHSSRKLSRLASRHSRDQLRHDKLTHDGGDGTPFRVRVARVAKNALVGETVGWMPDGMNDRADAVVMMWMQSPGHRQQLMRPRFRHIGVGRWYGAMGLTPGIAVTADFSSK
ncbi:MAG: CAP domain-containing protein [Solirubrobacteraceae bacterium]|nr:CAP domain-containing protein [Solirubrobacteraceae bacterium]